MLLMVHINHWTTRVVLMLWLSVVMCSTSKSCQCHQILSSWEKRCSEHRTIILYVAVFCLHWLVVVWQWPFWRFSLNLTVVDIVLYGELRFMLPYVYVFLTTSIFSLGREPALYISSRERSTIHVHVMPSVYIYVLVCAADWTAVLLV